MHLEAMRIYAYYMTCENGATLHTRTLISTTNDVAKRAYTSRLDVGYACTYELQAAEWVDGDGGCVIVGRWVY